MSQIDDSTRVRHMLAAARRGRELAEGRNREDLDSDDVLGLALVRLLEILGEAARGLSNDVRDRHPEIPWHQIIGLRNRVIHAYFNVDLDIVWQVAAVELTPLTDHLRDLLESEVWT